VKYFDKAYCINYPNLERREAVEKQFARVGIEPEYVFAKRPWFKFNVTNMRRNPPVEFACNMSHIKAVMRSYNDKRPIFFEDDVVFSANANLEIAAAKKFLPENWDVLYLGGHPRAPAELVGGNLYKVTTFSCAEAYAFNNGAQTRFVDFWCDRIGKEHGMYDFILGDFAAENNAYAIYPTITRQADVYSEIARRKDDKTGLIEKGWNNNT
jgi:GR25 family glycosyltransferase involved in LPS biosynthesis